MKKNILICIALMATIIAGAQETNRGATTAPTPLYRVGEMYCYGETTMDKKAYLLFLQQNCQDAYLQFRQGYNTSIAGWVLLSAGLGLDIGATTAMIVQQSKERKAWEKRRKTDSMAYYDSHFPFIPFILIGVGAALEIASIPTLCVGYSKMHNSVDIFNAKCSSKITARPYWSVNASGNGIGLTYNF